MIHWTWERRYTEVARFLYIFVIGCFFVSTSVVAQSDFSYLIQPDSVKKTGISFTFSYTSRLSLLTTESIGIRGVHSGIRFGKNRHRLTLAYFWANTDPSIQLLNFKEPEVALINLDGYLKKDLHYYNLMFYPYWMDRKRWRWSTPIELGIGTETSKTVFYKDLSVHFAKKYFIPIQCGGYFEFKASRYVGINVEFGYRYILAEHNTSTSLNGIYYGLGGNIYTAPLWRDLKKWHRSR